MKKPAFFWLIRALVSVAVAATLARLIYYSVSWRDLMIDVQNTSWWEWMAVVIYMAWLVWRPGAKRSSTEILPTKVANRER